MTVTVAILFLLVSVILVFAGRRRHAYPAPPGPPTKRTWLGSRTTIGLPSILPWKVYHEWSKSYGPLLSLSLPGITPRRVLLVSTYNALHTLYNTRSAIYSTRPTWEMAHLTGRQHNVAFTPYGPRLKRARRFLYEALGAKEVKSWGTLLDSEVNSFLSELVSLDEGNSGSTVSDMLHRHVSNTATMLTYGHRASPAYVAESEQINLDTGLSLIPGRWALEGFPLLKYVPSCIPGMGFKRWALQARARFENLVGSEFERAKHESESGNLGPCFISNALNFNLNREDQFMLKCTAGSIYGAATDTTSAILHSALHILSLNPSIQNTAYAHISSLTRLPVMSDELSLPYFTALIRELHRFRPVVNLISHAPLEEDVFEDLRVEKGIWVMGNIWSVCHDESLYNEPEEFRPERHLDTFGRIDNNIVDPRDFSFGFGRRRCPGENFANGHTFLFLARIIYLFEILPSTPPGSTDSFTKNGDKLEYTSTFISRPKKEHFNVRLKLRSEALNEFLRNGA